MLISDESISTASSACFKGAVFLFISCSSLAIISFSIWSMSHSIPLSTCSLYLLLALSFALAVRNIFVFASGSTHVPMSLPSIMTFFCAASCLWRFKSFSLTAGYFDIFEVIMLTCSVLIKSFTFSPFKITCCAPST